jgi:NAD-dependent SIR2 family protein deacetylase
MSATPRIADDALLDFVLRHPRLLVLTGAGCSTDSGIPDYRAADGAWKRQPPVQYGDFVRSERVRRRYWARSLLGWSGIRDARPNSTHHALAALEQGERLHWLVTQNVDGLHQRAGSRRITDLHGRLDTVECLDCGRSVTREAVQDELIALNAGWADLAAVLAPDGDADLGVVDYDHFRVPACAGCGGLLKPAVVFFGEQVPKARVEAALVRLNEADALLVVGSSLMVWSGYRFVRAARAMGKPAASINLGRTRADSEFDLKIKAPCGAVLGQLLAVLSPTCDAAPAAP